MVEYGENNTDSQTGQKEANLPLESNAEKNKEGSGENSEISKPREEPLNTELKIE